MQLEHSEIINKKHNYKMTLILDNIQSPQNIGLIIRTAEAMGIERVVVISEIINEFTPKIKRLTRSTENFIKIDFHNDLKSVINELKSDNYKIYALEKTSSSVNCKNFKYEFPCAIICGNEKSGVSEPALNSSEQHLHIDMYGKNTSLNVAIATAMLLINIVD
ncbi:TrmH family RNA methyltransferase [Weeksellaceae bacterium TAE3-ERU29]|nr:TrmH family RNA methyltransferase [Weeksellaceae bacterium TAE3-ERU29]